MRLDDYSVKEGKRVWLTVDELDELIETAETPIQRVAFMLGGKAGLRRSEIVSVTPEDFEQAPDGFVRVWGDYSKRDKYREAPVPDRLQHMVEPIAHDRDQDEPVVDVTGQTVYRWVLRAAEKLEDETGDEGWSYLDLHDLRRSWGGHLLWDCGVHKPVVMEFGGWEDQETFDEHYGGQITPEAQQREREKVYGDREPDREAASVFEPDSEAVSETYGRV